MLYLKVESIEFYKFPRVNLRRVHLLDMKPYPVARVHEHEYDSPAENGMRRTENNGSFTWKWDKPFDVALPEGEDQVLDIQIWICRTLNMRNKKVASVRVPAADFDRCSPPVERHYEMTFSENRIAESVGGVNIQLQIEAFLAEGKACTSRASSNAGPRRRYKGVQALAGSCVSGLTLISEIKHCYNRDDGYNYNVLNSDNGCADAQNDSEDVYDNCDDNI